MNKALVMMISFGLQEKSVTKKSCDMVCADNGKVCNVDALLIPDESTLQKVCDEVLPGNDGVEGANVEIRPVTKFNKCWGYAMVDVADGTVPSCHAINGFFVLGGQGIYGNTDDMARICACENPPL